MIRTRNLTRRFGTGRETVEAVRGIDLDVAAGEVVALLGPNGAGKSTTLRILTTLLPPSEGTAEVAGIDVREDPVGVRRRIGHIGQGNGSFNGLRTAEELYSQARFHGLSRRTARARTEELLAELQLADLAHRDVATLSGGQRRRLDVAMGLVHRPPLVFLDEPSAGLDPQSRAHLWEHITRLHREHGTTVVLTTHYLEEADSVADRVVVIDHGRVLADGTPDQLKSRVSGDLVSLELGTADGDRVPAELARALPGARDLVLEDHVARFRVERGDAAIPDIVRALDGVGVPLRGAQVRRPSLDDVFLSLTGRRLREDQPA